MVQGRRLLTAVCVALALSSATVITAVGHPADLLLGALLAAGMLLDVQLPKGGTVPLGHAGVMALAFLLDLPQYLAVVAMAVAVAAPLVAARAGTDGGIRWAARKVVAALAAGAVRGLLAAAVDWDPDLRWQVLVQVTCAGAAFVAVDAVSAGDRRGLRDRVAWPVQATLVAAAALIAVAYESLGFGAALVAVVPLLVTRISFARYAAASETYDQMMRALSIVPELAGHAEVGHGERVAAYTALLAAELGLGEEDRRRAVVAARLQHIGRIAMADPDESGPPPTEAEVAAAGAAILRESAELADVAAVVEAVGRGGGDDPVVAIVRIAAAFDLLVGDEPANASFAVTALAPRASGLMEVRVIGLLADVVGRRPEAVELAVSRGRQLAQAASDAARKGRDERA